MGLSSSLFPFVFVHVHPPLEVLAIEPRDQPHQVRLQGLLHEQWNEKRCDARGIVA